MASHLRIYNTVSCLEAPEFAMIPHAKGMQRSSKRYSNTHEEKKGKGFHKSKSYQHEKDQDSQKSGQDAISKELYRSYRGCCDVQIFIS